MTGQILVGLGVMAVSVMIQVVAVVVTVRYLIGLEWWQKSRVGMWRDVGALSAVMVMIFVGHLVQIGLWAWLFLALGEFADFGTAYYHSAVNFASLGYGDIVMSEEHRLLGALEAGNGVLMFGLSAAAMYAVLIKMLEGRWKES
jgi:hypothetical protein